MRCPSLTYEEKQAKFVEMKAAWSKTNTTAFNTSTSTRIDGHLNIGSTTVPFTFDTGATETFISMDGALAAIHDTSVLLTPLEKPFPVQTATAGAAGALTATHKLRIDANIEFIDGSTKLIPSLTMFIVPGLTTDVILIGHGTIRTRFGLNIAQLIQATSAAPPPDDDYTLESAAVLRAIVLEADNEMPLPVSDNDPTYVASLVNTALDDMHANGISITNTTKLRDFIATTTPDLFRTSISNDPPARMPPVQLEVDQELFNKLRPPPHPKI
jgi:hypothetical protein